MTVSDAIALLGDYSAVIIAVAGVVALLNRWMANRILDVLRPQLDSISERMDSAERQLLANGGRSLRDAVNRIENAQKRDRITLNQLVRAANDAGMRAPLEPADDTEVEHDPRT